MWQNGGMPSAAKPTPGPLSAATAAILRAQKGRLDLTTGQIAEAAGISRQQLSGILNSVKHVDIEQLDQICYALGLNLVDVVKEAEAESAARKLSAQWPARPIQK